LRLIVPAFAGEVLAEGGSALLLLAYEGEPPPSTKVSVRNLTKGQWLGTYNVLNSLQLVGAPGDRVQLAIEARGYERTRIELTLQEAAESYTVRLQENRTPLFLQRLTPAAKAMALPSRGARHGRHGRGQHDRRGGPGAIAGARGISPPSPPGIAAGRNRRSSFRRAAAGEARARRGPRR
jgi:hypothetical protein